MYIYHGFILSILIIFSKLTGYSSLITKGTNYYRDIGLDYLPEKRDNWTINDYLRRLKTFFPNEKYKLAYETLIVACQKRNDFIYNCFKINNGEINSINLDNEKVHLDENALEKTNEWIKAYNNALKIILGLMIKVSKAKSI